MKNQPKGRFYNISEFRRKVGIPLVLARKLVIWGEIKTVKTLDGTFAIAESEVQKIKALLRNPREKILLFVKALGPGLITGASDDDPSGIGTYSSVGAQFGLGIIWMAPWLLPIMLAVQEVCARIGIVTNKGLAGVLLQHYSKRIVMLAVVLLIIANVVNIGADIAAMAASLEMLGRVNYYIGAILFTAIILLLEVFVQYHLYVKFLKWLTISILAYVIAGFLIKPDWWVVLKQSFVPRVTLNTDYIFAMIAVFGTTITPYLFFWQTSQEVEENKLVKGDFSGTLIHEKIARMRTDVNTGMILANVVFYFIVLTTAQVLFKNGITEIASAEQAALALRPLAGEYAYFLFAAGIIGTGLLAIPVLAGSGAYALAEVMKWEEGLELKFSQAKGFYLVIAFSMLVGLALNFFQVNPITALYYSAYLNGIIALPLLFIIMVVGNDPEIVGEETHPGYVKFFGWLAVLFMVLAVLFSVFLPFFKN